MNAAYFSLAVLLTQPQSPSPFNGSWLIDVPSAIKDAEQESFAIKNGIFSRGEGTSNLIVKADGRFHPISSDDYVDAVAVTIVSPSKVRELDRFKGKLVYSVVYTVSPDGNTMTRKVVDFSNPDHRPVPTTVTHRRVGRPQRAGSLVSGRWATVGVTTTRDHLTETIELNGTRFSSSGPGGAGYDAMIGGPPVPMRGDAASARVAVNMPNDRTIVVNMSLKGISTVLMTMTLLPDDRTINVTARRLSDGVDSSWVMHKR